MAIKKDLLLAGYNLLVTSEIDMPDRKIYDTYHNLWRIEESFQNHEARSACASCFLGEAGNDSGAFSDLLSDDAAGKAASGENTGESVFGK